ncbi:MAG: sulfotransferase domain-containing protein [Nitrospirae bacterium]|nr:sulfotransferase domain-containing protein [Nitrospirota bacterium]
MTLPNVIIIGVQKGGTTSLFDYMSQHPQVYAPPAMKEFPFFCREDYFCRGLKWFSGFFEDWKNEKVILHGYVNYIYHYEPSAKRIFEYNKDSKLILILRNPAERAYSAYWQARKMGIESIESFEEAIEAEKARLHGDFIERSGLTYIDHGFYSKQLSHFYKYFDEKDILFILFDELVKDPKAALRQVFAFIGVDPVIDDISLAVQNPAGLPRNKAVQSLLATTLPLPAFLKDMMPLDKRIMIKSFLKRLNIKDTSYPPLGEVVSRHLLNVYREDILALQDMIQKDLSRWLS